MPILFQGIAWRLIVEINRNIDIFSNEHEDAIRSRNPRLIWQANQTRQDLEQTSNELRSMENVSDTLGVRVTKAVSRVDKILINYESIQPEIRPVESQGQLVGDLPAPPAPPIGNAEGEDLLGDDVENLLFPGQDSPNHDANQSVLIR